MFEHLQPAPPDPILGLNEAFAKDDNPNKINLGVGVYRDDSGTTPTLAAVRTAEKRLAEQDPAKTYLPITGAPAYGAHVQRLLFGAGSVIVNEGRAVTAHSPGGTGGLRVAAEFTKTHAAGKRIWASSPTWANHHGVFRAAGVEVKDYPYYDPATKGLDFGAMKAALAEAPAGDLVLLHGCCHNPTGVDPTAEQWDELLELFLEKRLVPFFDVAYQGFGDGLDDDVVGLRKFAAKCPEMVVASSFSKNFGLYNERVGAVTLVSQNSKTAGVVAGHLKRVIRTNYSNPPRHGEAIIVTILDDEGLTAQWKKELAAMRGRINSMRGALVEGLAKAGIDRDFSFITRQRGMFSFSGLTKEQVEALKKDHAIYIVGSGRINVAGISSSKLEYLCSAIAQVLK